MKSENANSILLSTVPTGILYQTYAQQRCAWTAQNQEQTETAWNWSQFWVVLVILDQQFSGLICHETDVTLKPGGLPVFDPNWEKPKELMI